MSLRRSRIRLLEIARSQDRHGDFRHVLSNGAKLFTSKTFVTGIRLVQVVVVARFLGVSGYGQYVTLTVFVLAVNQFLDVRVSETTIRFGSEYQAAGEWGRLAATVKLSYLVDLCTGLLAFVVVYLIAPWGAGTILHAPALEWAIRLYAWTLLISTVDNTSNAVLKISDRFGWAAIYGGAMAVLELAAIGVAIVLSRGLIGIIVALLVKDVVSAITNVSLARKALSNDLPADVFWRSSFRLVSDRYRELVRFVLSTNFVAYLRMAATKLDVLLLSFFTSADEVGLYKVAMNVSGAVLRISDPLFAAILPDLTSLWSSGKNKRFRNLVKNVSFAALVGFIPAVILILAFKNQALGFFFGAEYVGAAPLISIGIWGFLCGCVFFWIWPALLSIGRPEIAVYVGAVSAVLQIALIYYLAPRYGAVGVVWSFVVTQVLSHIILLASLQKLLNREDQFPPVMAKAHT